MKTVRSYRHIFHDVSSALNGRRVNLFRGGRPDKTAGYLFFLRPEGFDICQRAALRSQNVLASPQRAIK